MVEPPLIVLRRCVRMLHPLPKNVQFSSRLVSTLLIAHWPSAIGAPLTTHPPRCCEDHARLVADKLANGKEPKEAWRPAPNNRYRDGAPPLSLRAPQHRNSHHSSHHSGHHSSDLHSTYKFRPGACRSGTRSRHDHMPTPSRMAAKARQTSGRPWQDGLWVSHLPAQSGPCSRR